MQTGEPENRRRDVPPPSSRWPEARFRIQAANALPRTVRVIALDDANADVALCRAQRSRAWASFTGPGDFRACVGDTAGALLAGDAADALRDARFAAWLGAPDLVVVVGTEGDDPALGMLAARAYKGRSVSISGLVCRRPGADDSQTSDALRPVCTTMMLVDAGYLDNLLDALGVRE